MLRHIKRVFELEASTGILLIIATFFALLVANNTNLYQLFSLPVINNSMSLLDLINDGFMAVFFLLIGLELKQEVLVGELSSKKKIALPLIAAIGGMLMPAIIFYICNHNHPHNLVGFAIPTATDIAFAYGIICLFGKKIAKSTKVFLISLAIFDDLGAIILIAIFYASKINLLLLLASSMILFFLFFLGNRCLWLWLLLGFVLWLLVLKSGVHATIAGVALAMVVPTDSISKTIGKIGPSVNFFILPIFAFANSGVVIDANLWQKIDVNLFAGVFFGLFLGKQLGVVIFSLIAIKLGITTLPRKGDGSISFGEFYAASLLTGIGFTMSFFIGSLAFATQPQALDTIKIAVLLASTLSTITAIITFWFSAN